MVDISEIKQAARIMTDQNGESVVQIPASLWQDFLAQVEQHPSQVNQIMSLVQEWEKDSENEMPAGWWDEFTEFLSQNRVNLTERDFGLDSE